MLLSSLPCSADKKHAIDPYYKDHPDEDKEAKRALNIYDQEDERRRGKGF